MSPYYLAYFVVLGIFVMCWMMIYHAPPQDSRTMLGALIAGLVALLIKVGEIIERMHDGRGELRRPAKRRSRIRKPKTPPDPSP